MPGHCKILFVIPNLCGGGAERVVTTLLRNLDRARFIPMIAVVDMGNAVYLREIPDDVVLFDLRCSRVLFAIPKVIRLIWKRKPDVVFTTLGHLNLALAMVRLLLPDRVSYIARETSIVSETLNNYSLKCLWKWAYKVFYPSFDLVVCQSRYMRDDLINNFLFPADKTVVIHNPVDAERIRHFIKQPVSTGMKCTAAPLDNLSAIHLVAAGRLEWNKGFDLLIEALAKCADPRFFLTILGEGPLRDSLENLAREKGIAHQVRFAGFQDNPFPFFAQADAFVMCSRSEGFPNVVLEALACGTPVIAIPAPGGIKEILGGLDGCVLADSVSSEALARAIKSMSFDRRVSQSVIAPYDVKEIVERYSREFVCHSHN